MRRNAIPVAARLLRRLPVTVGFLLLLSATTAVLAVADDSLRGWLLKSSSSNLSHLARDPLRVLVASFFWVEPSGFVTMVLPTALLLAAVEWRVGWRRTLLVFAAGHLGATLLAAAGIWAGIHLGTLDPSVANSLDVGVSYATFALAAYATWLMGVAARAAGIAVLVLYLSRGAIADRTFTDFGHLFALAIGAGLGLLRRPLPGRRRLAATAVCTAVLVLLAPAAGLIELAPPSAATHPQQPRKPHAAGTGTASAAAVRSNRV